MVDERRPLSVAALLRGDNRRMVGKLVVVATLMFGFGYALVPIYRAVCTALGLNVLSLSEQLTSADKGGRATRDPNTQIDRSRTVTVEFDANARGVWDFKPAQRSVDVHPGELTTVMYEFRNTQNRTMAAQAIPSYAPMQAMAHFNKVECFCFNEYTMKPGESRQWPVVFYLDPKLPKDVRTITLSYTFFEVGGKVPPGAASGRHGGPERSRVLNDAVKGDGLKDAVRRKGSFRQTMGAVGWSFFGVRKAVDYERDVNQLNPVHVVIAGVLGAALFIALLLALVSWVLSSGIAA